MEWNLEEAIQYYKSLGAPQDQSALISLLREIQRECGGKIPEYMLLEIAVSYKVNESFLKAIIRRIPTLRIENSHCLEICSGPYCGKQSSLSQFAESYLNEYPGKFTLKYMPCMRMCGKGPNVKWDGRLHHNADLELLTHLFEE